ncbi:MAG: hypothetical protein ACLP1Y_00565 [Candidatus Acidiferrales bacterium]
MGYSDPCWNGWYDPWWGWDQPACYGYSYYYDPTISYYPDYDDDSNSANTVDYSAPANDQPANDQEAAPAENAPSPDANADSTSGSTSTSHAPVLLYLKNGAEFDVSAYWVEDGKLHYTLADGGEIAISIDQLDLQRTIEQNAKRGVYFNLNDSQGGSSAEPGAEPSAPSEN